MLVLLFALATLLSWMLLNLVYVLVTAAVARRFGIWVRDVSLGVGPTLWTWGRPEHGAWCLKLLPLGASVRFRNEEEDDLAGEPFEDDAWDGEEEFEEGPESEENREWVAASSFEAASAGRRIVTALAGPASSLLIGLVLLGIPVWRGTEQMVAASGEVAAVRPTAVSGLASVDAPSRWQGQTQLVWDTAGYYFTRLCTFRSLEGWGGWVALLTAGGRLGASSLEDWFLLLGIVAVAAGAIHLLPLPAMNGFQILQALVAAGLGRARVSERVLTPLLWVGLLYWLACFAHALLLDARWIKDNWLT